MTETELNEEYFEWMCQLIGGECCLEGISHRKLLEYLNDIEFIYSILMDENRAVDGIYLRYRFGFEEAYSDSVIEKYLDVKACSVLEMMVALANRCEESIMADYEIGDQTGKWFWDMIDSLDLTDMDDEHFDEKRVGSIIRRFLERRYRRDGKGGLFTVKKCKTDMRQVEIWYQMCWYLDSL